MTDNLRSGSKFETGTKTDAPANEVSQDAGILQEIGNIGAGHAATSLSQIVQQRIEIDVPTIRSMQTHLVPKFYARHDKLTTAVYMQLDSELECDILLLFEKEEAEKIASIMTMATSPENVSPEMESSAIQELANIMIGAFLSAISNFTGTKLVPKPPQLTVDSFDSIIDNFLVRQSMLSDIAIIFDTQFKQAGGTASGNLIVFPSRRLQETLIEKANQLVAGDP
jgi:chemotaxis protein CheC